MLAATPDLRALQYVQTRNLTIRFDQPQGIQLDGDSFGKVTSVSAALRPRGLIIRVPKQ